jgi:uncharacterized protein (TIGR02246 family)
MNYPPLIEGDSLMTATHQHTDPRTVALGVLARLEAAWNDADGPAFGRAYAPDASFVTIRGQYIVGSTPIGEGHAGIFSTIYAGSVNRMELVRAEEVSDGVILVVSLNTLDCPTGPLVGRHQAMSTSVLIRPEAGDGTWRIVSTHNTLVMA